MTEVERDIDRGIADLREVLSRGLTQWSDGHLISADLALLLILRKLLGLPASGGPMTLQEAFDALEKRFPATESWVFKIGRGLPPDPAAPPHQHRLIWGYGGRLCGGAYQSVMQSADTPDELVRLLIES